MTDPNLWLLAGILMYAPHLSKFTGFLLSVVFLALGYHLRYFG